MSKRHPYSEFGNEHCLLVPNKIRKKLAFAEKAAKRSALIRDADGSNSQFSGWAKG
jgi:hypothetical protein